MTPAQRRVAEVLALRPPDPAGWLLGTIQEELDRRGHPWTGAERVLEKMRAGGLVETLYSGQAFRYQLTAAGQAARG